jgi:HK97 family phage major capsid protein
MSSRIPNIRRAINSMRWAMLPEKLEAMVDMLEARARLGRPFTDAEISERVAGVTLVAPHAAAPRPIKGKGGAVAILSLTGIIAPKASMVNGPSLPQGTACESFAAAFDQAMADEDVTHIVIDVDSPGGSVEGVPELAARITSARGKKPITAVANVMAASAAYWIASAADELVVAPSGEVGSIGVYQVHFDFSEQLAQEGITPTIIKAGQFKAEGNPLEPLSADAKDYAQAQIEEFYSMFVGAVAKQRNVSKQTVLKDYGQGRMLLARNAVGAGVADRIGTLESVLGKLGVSNAAYLNARRGQQAEAPQLEIAAAAGSGEIAAAAVVQGNTFSTTVGDAAPATLTLLRENQPAPQGQEQTVPDTASAPPGGAATNASDIAVAAERKRVQEIRKLCREHAVDDANFADTLIETGASVDVAARQILDLKRTQVAAGPQIHGMRDRAADKPFDSLGDQLMAVVRAGKGVVDPRLQRFAGTPSGMNESVGSEGGFLISPDFLPGLTKVIFGDDPILSRVKRIPSAKNIVKYNVLDETSRATGSRGGGVQVFWAAEADAGTPKKPRFRQMVLDKKKVIGLAYLTDELLDDAPASQAIVSDAFTSELAFTIANAVFRGSGAGQPQGFLNSGAVASVAIEAAQTIANTAQFDRDQHLEDVGARSGLALGRRGLHVQSGAAPQAGRRYDRHLRRGAGVHGCRRNVGQALRHHLGPSGYASELCEAEGTPGDIICVAPSQYAVLGGDATKFAESIHVRFVNDENALRFTTRVDGAPEWVSTITRFKGSGALSPFVTLATRS